MYSVDTCRELNYERALRLIDELKKNNIDANISVGGIGIYPSTNKEKSDMMYVCKKYGVKPSKGLTMREQDTLYR